MAWSIWYMTLFKDLGLSIATVQKEHINHAQVSTYVAGIFGPTATGCQLSRMAVYCTGTNKPNVSVEYFSTLSTVASFSIGLPWGASGVAASYSIAWTFVTLSLLLLLWFTGRIDPVKTKDFYVAAAPIVLVASATTLIIFRYFFSSSNAILSLATAGDITLSFIEALFTLSSGRLILQDLKKNSESLTLNNFKDDLLYGL
jgi:hypothetical protein